MIGSHSSSRHGVRGCDPLLDTGLVEREVEARTPRHLPRLRGTSPARVTPQRTANACPPAAAMIGAGTRDPLL